MRPLPFVEPVVQVSFAVWYTCWSSARSARSSNSEQDHLVVVYRFPWAVLDLHRSFLLLGFHSVEAVASVEEPYFLGASVSMARLVVDNGMAFPYLVEVGVILDSLVGIVLVVDFSGGPLVSYEDDPC